MKRNLKQKIASALIVSMMAGLTVSPAWGAENKPTWIFEDGVWHLYDKDGDLVKDGVKRQGGKWWAFDEEGAMLTDQLYFCRKFIGNDTDSGEENQPNSYIFPDGHMAKENWVALTGEGEDARLYVYDEDAKADDINWYYFENVDDDEEYPGRMITNAVDAVNDGTFAWDEEGKMYSGTWLYVVENQPYTEDSDFIADNDVFQGTSYYLRYFMQEGYMAKKKTLLLGDYWYRFNSDGEIYEVIPYATNSDADPKVTNVDIASSSDTQPARLVDRIEFMGDSNIIEETPGKDVILNFKIHLATSSNAVENPEFDEDNHDIWLSLNKSGSTRFRVKDNIISVTYKPKLTTEEKVQLFIDDDENKKWQSEVITIRPKLSSSTDFKNAVNNVMDNWNSSNITAEAAKESIDNFIQTATVSDASKKTALNALAQDDSYDNLAQHYASSNGITEASNVSDEVSQLLKSGEVTIVGGALNADPNSDVTLNVSLADSTLIPDSVEGAAKAAFDLTLEIDGESQSELWYPVKITMPVPTGIETSSVKLYHIHNGNTSQVKITIDEEANTITFITDSFSTYIFAGDAEETETTDPGTGDDNTGDNEDNTPGGGSSSSGSGGGGGGSSSSSTSSAGTVITDPKKGQVNSVTGIITGSGDGYSSWVATTAEDGTVTWQLRYADGTMAAGSIVTREDGTTYEQLTWEMINGAWYAFGADSIAKGGMIYDVDLGGYFYVDINSGMITGWAQIDGQWRYFNPVSDGKRGIMFTDSWIDGWYVDPNGIWDGQAQAQ